MEELSGVMSLPEAQGPGMAPDQAAIFEQIRQNVPRQEITQELLSAGEQADPQAVAEFKQELAGLELTPDELNKLNTMVDAILAAPQDYASLRRAYLAEGMPEDLLPEQFDPAFFAALNMAIDTIAMNPASPPPMAMAGGGVANLAAYGRNGDTMLAHITPQEAAMLKRMGGAGTINPYTGLPEYASIFKKIGNAVKKFAKSTVGKIIIGAGLAIFAGPAAAAWLGSAAGGAGLTGVAGFLSSTAGSAAVGGFLAGAGTTLAAGGNLKQALKAGAIGGLSGAALAGVTGGMDAFAARPEVTGNLLPQNPSLSGPSGFDYVSGAPLSPELTPGAGLSSSISPGAFPDTVMSAAATDRLVSPVVPVQAGPASMPPIAAGPAPSELAGFDALPRMDVNTAYSPAAASVQPPPSGGGGGIMDLVKQGEYGKALGTAYDRYMPEALGGQRGAVSPEMIEAARPKAELSVLRTYPSVDPGSATFQRLVTAEATKLATPGVLSTYGPVAGLGIAALGAMGGFKPEQPQMPDMFKGPTGYQMYFRDPVRFGLQYGGVRPTAYGGMYLQPPGYAMGGGVMDTPQAMRVGGKTYPRKTGPINGPGTGTSDSIPAMLSDGEFVFTAKAVRAMGNGSRRKGAKKMYKLMKMLEGKAA
jgi:hypothetical protein